MVLLADEPGEGDAGAQGGVSGVDYVVGGADGAAGAGAVGAAAVSGEPDDELWERVGYVSGDEGDGGGEYDLGR